MRIAPACVVSFCLAAALQGAAPARTPITCGPYLQSPGATDMTIMWETAAPAAGKLLYGTTPEYGWSFFEPEAVVLHAVALSDLQPGTRYHYKVLPTLPAEEAHARTGTFVTAPAGKDVSTLPAEEAHARTGTFVTAPADKDGFVFAAFGDSRDNPVVLEAIAEKVAAAAPAFFIHLGDFVANGNQSALWRRDFFAPAAALLSTAPLLPVLGNHEEHAPQYFQYFMVPAVESGSDTEAWYSCDYGSVHITVLDSQQDFRPTSAQYRWLLRDLASERADAAAWRIVALHDHVHSSSRRGPNTLVQKHLAPLWEAYRVSLVLSGHEHAYMRSVKNGITYVVTGGGGAPLYPVNLIENPFQVYANSCYHYVLFEADATSLRGRAHDAAGELLDKFSIDPPPPR